MACNITPTRRRWLEHLATQRHETRWHHMPAREGGGRGAVTNATWRPMVEAGLITARFGQRSFREPSDWLFAITDAGRAALAGEATTEAILPDMTAEEHDQ